MEVTLGDEYRDEITGFAGVATGRTVYLNGCVSVLLEAGENGKPASHWFDEQRLIGATSAATAGGGPEAPRLPAP